MKALSRLIILSGSLFLTLLPGKIDSCGFYVMGEEYRFWLFQPNYKQENNLRPFFYSADYMFWDDDGSYNNPNASNTRDWFNYLGGRVKQEDIHSILNETNPVTFFNKTDSLKYNGFYTYLKKNNPEAWQYLNLAKKIEGVGNSYNSWSCYDCPDIAFPGQPVPEIDEPEISELRDKALLMYDKSSDRFLKERLAYQLVRFLTSNLEEAKRFYKEKLLPVQSESWVKYAALLNIASNYNGPQSDYELSLVFDRCPDKAYRAIQVFDNSNGTINLAKNNHEKAVIHCMKLMQEPFRALTGLNTIYNLDPTNKHLEMLVVREINKLEDWLLTPRYTEYRPAVYKADPNDEKDNWYWWRHNSNAIKQNLKRDSAYAVQVENFIQKVITDNTRNDNAFLHLCTGYLAFMNRDFVKAREHYNQASIDTRLSKEARFQLEMNQLALRISENPVPDKNLEDQVYKIALKLDPKSTEYYGESKGMRDQFYQMIANIYMEHGQLAKGVLILSQSTGAYGDFYDNYKGAQHVLLEKGKPKDYDDLIVILKEKNKTNFEKLITGHCQYPVWAENWDEPQQWDVNRVLDLKSIYYVRQDQLESAYATVSKIEDCYWNNFPYQMFINDDPFLVSPWNSHSSFNPAEKIYNKRTFLKELVNLKRQAAKSTGNTKAKLLYKIGNAYLSMTWRGKYWIMSSTFNSSSEESISPALNNKEFINYYYFNGRAQKYYEASFACATNKEIRALSALMATNCLRGVDGYNDEFIKGQKGYLRKYPNSADVRDLSGNCELFMQLMNKYYINKK